jgi:subtilisin family serine protease
LTGPPAKRYLRRRGYSATPVVDRVLDSLAKDHRIERIEGWPIRSLRVYCEVFRVPAGTGVDRVVANLAADPRVDLVERMSTFETLIGRYDDPYGDLQWSVPQLELEEAHLLATGRGVTVAVIDSDIDAAHPDLKDRVKLQRDLVGGGKNPHGGEIHGTAVAGIIASVVDNDEGIIGIAPDVSIAALRACWSETEQDPNAICSSFTLAKALEAAIQIAPQVINLSLAGPFEPQPPAPTTSRAAFPPLIRK